MMGGYREYSISGSALTAKPVTSKKGRYLLVRSNGSAVALAFRKPGKQTWMYILPDEKGELPTHQANLSLVYGLWHGPWPSLQYAGRAVWTEYLRNLKGRSVQQEEEAPQVRSA